MEVGTAFQDSVTVSIYQILTTYQLVLYLRCVCVCVYKRFCEHSTSPMKCEDNFVDEETSIERRTILSKLAQQSRAGIPVSAAGLLLFDSTFHNFLPIWVRRKRILRELADTPTRTRKERAG